MASNKTVRIDVLEKPLEVGKSLKIITASINPKFPGKVWSYIPLSCLWEIHPDHVVMDEWVAIKKEIYKK